MATLVRDAWIEKRLRAERKASGADRWDEVWDGVYVMPPMPNDEHQGLVMSLSWLLQSVVGVPGLGLVRPGVNVSDRKKGWKKNYRVPDVAVFLKGTRAVNYDTFWCGGPDFVVEITSPGDDTRAKLPFYGRVGTRELLLIDRDPWALELYHLSEERLGLAGVANLERPAVLTSSVLPLTFTLVPADARPLIEVTHRESGERWPV